LYAAAFRWSAAAHGDDAAPSRRLRNLRYDSRHPARRPYQILAPSASIIVASLRRFTSGQTELDPNISLVAMPDCHSGIARPFAPLHQRLLLLLV
jgi:hypothetical protein